MDSKQVSDLMNRRPLTIAPDIGVIVAMRQLLQKQVSAAAVVDASGTLVGVISEADCLKGTLMGGYFEEVGELVAERMTKEVCTVAPDTNLVDAAELMLRNKRRVLPVVDNGRVVGALSRSAVIATIIETMDTAAYA